MTTIESMITYMEALTEVPDYETEPTKSAYADFRERVTHIVDQYRSKFLFDDEVMTLLQRVKTDMEAWNRRL